MSSRISNILGTCLCEAALRATKDNIKQPPNLFCFANDEDAEEDEEPEETVAAKKNKKTGKRVGRLAGKVFEGKSPEEEMETDFKGDNDAILLLGKHKKRHVSLLEAYQYTYTQETIKALGNGTNEGLGDETDEAVGSRTREYITRRSKRDAVEAAMKDEHGPDASRHPPNDFDLW
nr:hypothetical protein [Tanacetum cinerariifolium]